MLILGYLTRFQYILIKCYNYIECTRTMQLKDISISIFGKVYRLEVTYLSSKPCQKYPLHKLIEIRFKNVKLLRKCKNVPDVFICPLVLVKLNTAGTVDTFSQYTWNYPTIYFRY